ncbi:immunoglobulin light [Labeo rohita]|nr:immunoglobulin light [Labeo rohita]RXN37345.1 immunoglobulin light [Labeo rohita]
MKFVSLWVTFGSGTKLDVGSVTRPKVSVLPPSSAEISSKKTATLVCVANKGFPSDWSLSWKVDGSSRSQESSAGLLEKDGLYSWSSSLTLSEQEWMESVSVSCEATRSGQPALTGHVTRHQCSE